MNVKFEENYGRFYRIFNIIKDKDNYNSDENY